MCSLLGFLLAPGWRMGPGGAVVFFFFFLCVSCLSVCEVTGRGGGCGKLLGARGRTKLPPRSSRSPWVKEAPGARRPAAGALPLPR